jgi:uncharacterized protein (UPF0276 family)
MTSSLSRTSLGIGLRPVHYSEIFENPPQVDFFEIISENFLTTAPAPRANLSRILETHPVVLHGVSLNLLGENDPSTQYLDQVAELCAFTKAPYFTDHLCWTGAHGFAHHDLLPTPYTRELIDIAAERAQFVQKYVGIPFGIENLSSYIDFSSSEMNEWEFYNRIIAQSGCWAMLDINNIYVSAHNHHFKALDYIESVNWKRVLQCHVAGHTLTPNGIIVDTHDHEVCDGVWELYQAAWSFGGPFPTLLEWDGNIPPLQNVVDEVLKARSYQKYFHNVAVT